MNTQSKIVMLLTGAVMAASTTIAYAADRASQDQAAVSKNANAVRFLSLAESRSLNLKLAPSTSGSRLVVGHDWRCYENSAGWETCEPVLIICLEDQSDCVEV